MILYNLMNYLTKKKKKSMNKIFKGVCYKQKQINLNNTIQQMFLFSTIGLLS